jgi:hypothetical protein
MLYLFVLLSLFCVVTLLFAPALWFWGYALVTINTCFLGFCMLPGLSVGLEFACEIGYPISEAALSGFTLSLGQFLSCLMVFLL